GCVSSDSAEVDRVRARPARFGGRGRSHRILYFPIIDKEEDASRAGADGHIRQAWTCPEAPGRQTRQSGGSPEGSRTQKEDTDFAASAVQRCPRTASSKMQSCETKPDPRHLRKGSVWRTRTPDHSEAFGCRQG